LGLPFGHLSSRIGSSRRRPVQAYVEQSSVEATKVAPDAFSAFHQGDLSLKKEEAQATDQDILQFLKQSNLLSSSKKQASVVVGRGLAGRKDFASFCTLTNVSVSSACAAPGTVFPGPYSNISTSITYPGSPGYWDYLPPTFVANPSVTSVTTTGFTIGASISESGKAYYMVIPFAGAAPTAAQVKGELIMGP